MEQRQLLDVAETAEMLRLKESTIRSWILKRRIPFVRMGRRVFVRRADAQRLIDSVVMPEPTQMSDTIQ
jgi:excisionase family DNA binding protein